MNFTVVGAIYYAKDALIDRIEIVDGWYLISNSHKYHI